MATRRWATIDDVIDNFSTGNTLAVTVNDVTIFANNEIQHMLSDLYDSFSFRYKETETPLQGFTRQYSDYVNSVGYNYYRMYDALRREYNPINNYAMTESSIDGRKVSDTQTFRTENGYDGNTEGKVTNTEEPYSKETTNVKTGDITVNMSETSTTVDGTSNTVGGTTTGTETIEKTGTETIEKTGRETVEKTGTETIEKTGTETVTNNGTETVDSYRNAFDSGISDTGTHTERNATTFDNRTTSTDFGDSGNGVKQTTNYGSSGNGVKETTDYGSEGSGIKQTTNYGSTGDGVKQTTTTSTQNPTTNETNNSTTTTTPTTETTSYGNGVTDTMTETLSADKVSTSEKEKITDEISATDYENNTTRTEASMTFTDVNQKFDSEKNRETHGNDITLTYNKEAPDGTSQIVNVGADFTDGTMHELTRAGNIGVTTNAQMISGELEMRRVNLLTDFIKAFVSYYCTFLGIGEC